MELHEQFDKCKNDVERWQWIKDNQDKGLLVMLDNDDTFIVNQRDEEAGTMDFDGYVGWSDGVISLLDAMGIKAEPV